MEKIYAEVVSSTFFDITYENQRNLENIQEKIDDFKLLPRLEEVIHLVEKSTNDWKQVDKNVRKLLPKEKKLEMNWKINIIYSLWKWL